MKKRKLIIPLTILVLLSACAIYLSTGYKATPEAKKLLEGSSLYSVESKSYGTEFIPSSSENTIGVIVYPGGKVQHTAYSPIASGIAEGGYLTVIAKMPFNLAIFNSNAADSIIKAHSEINTWVICGHSLGGVMASSYAIKHTDKIQGIVFWAAYPKDDMSSSSIKALSLHGTLDGLVSKDKLTDTKKLFPKDTEFVEIEGGNHCSFGSYGFQKGDNKAEITATQQQEIAVETMLEFLKTSDPQF